MVLDTTGISEKVRTFAERVAGEFRVNKVILFGSFVNGGFSEDSDIDVAVIIDDNGLDLLDSEFRMYKMRRDIDYRIEPIVFFGYDDKSGFLDEILRTGQVVYEAA